MRMQKSDIMDIGDSVRKAERQVRGKRLHIGTMYTAWVTGTLKSQKSPLKNLSAGRGDSHL